MKAVGIVGYKKSGKTTLLVNLVRELTKRGYRISSVKHSSSRLDLANTDTDLHKQYCKEVGAITPDDSAIFFQESFSLDKMLDYLECDLVLVEGFKTEKTFPKIVLLRPEDDPKSLLDGLEIYVISQNETSYNIEEIADLVLDKAFKLPNLNCGACGYETCYEMAKEIVKGIKTVEDCKALNGEIQVKINDKVMPMNPFTSRILRNTVDGMLSALKGYQKGKIEINID